MFTGLVEGTANVVSLAPVGDGARLVLDVGELVPGVKQGDSVAVNGCCLTIVEREETLLKFDLLRETLSKTNLGGLGAGSVANVERALAAGDRLGGHFVQGHIDCTARVLGYDFRAPDHRLEIELPREFAHYVVYKGSISVNGISLTIAEALAESFVIWIIPHTHEVTNLRSIQAGDEVNLEFDMLAKYLESLMSKRLA